MADEGKTLGDVAWLLAEYLIEANRSLADLILDRFTDLSTELRELVVSNQENLDQRVQYLGEQVGEVVQAVNALKEQVAGMNVDFTQLDAAIQPLADIVPDAEPQPEPTPEP